MIALALALIVVGAGVLAWDIHDRHRVDPVDHHAATVTAALWPDALPRTPAERFADDVEQWLCDLTCFPPIPTEEI